MTMSMPFTKNPIPISTGYMACVDVDVLDVDAVALTNCRHKSPQFLTTDFVCIHKILFQITHTA